MSAPAAAPRVLMVEDDQALRQMLHWDLEDLGYQVISVADCHGALAHAAEQRFDIALLDYRLPDGNGIELLKGLRKMAPALPAFMSSAMAGPDIRRKARLLSVNGFFTKPTSVQTLDQAFRRVID